MKESFAKWPMKKSEQFLIQYHIYQPLHSGSIWHKVNF